MRRSWSAVSLGGGIVLSILAAERLGQDAPVQRLGGGEVEQPGQGRCDVDRADAPLIGAASDPGTPQDQRHVRIQLGRLTVHRDRRIRVAPDRVRLEGHDELTPPSAGTWCIQRRATGSAVSLAVKAAGRSTRATPAIARSRVATSATTLSTFTPWATSLARSESSSMPLSNWSQSPPPARWSSAPFTLWMIVSGITRTAPGCPRARDRSGYGVTPWSAVSTTSTLFRP